VEWVSAPKENKCWEREALGALPKEQLIELVMALQERVAELERRLGMNSQNSSRPPSSDLPGTERAKPPATGRRPGGQPGHPGQFRKMVPIERVDKLVPLKPLQCRHCGAPLTGEDPSPRRHQVVELPPIRPRVTEYQQHKLRCRCCGQTTVGEWPAGLDYGAFGERLRSLVALCTGVCHLSRRRTAFLLESLFHVPISVGAISRSEQFVSAAIAEPVEQCQQYVQSQPVVHVDETGWPIKYHSGWLWTAATSLATVFQIHSGRGQKEARLLLGQFEGILESDRWGAYNAFPLMLRQVCWAHLKRDFQAMAERGSVAGQIGSNLLELTQQMFQGWHRVRDQTLSREQFQSQMLSVSRQLEKLFDQGAHCGHAKTQRTCRRLLKIRPALWTFVHTEGVEPTNNAAERAIRPAVLWRKSCFGSQGPPGCRFVERMLTVTATLGLQRRNVVEYLALACHAALHNHAAPSLLPLAPSPAGT